MHVHADDAASKQSADALVASLIAPILILLFLCLAALLELAGVQVLVEECLSDHVHVCVGGGTAVLSICMQPM